MAQWLNGKSENSSDHDSYFVLPFSPLRPYALAPLRR